MDDFMGDLNHHDASEGDTNVRVAVRCRPFNEREKAMNDNQKKCIDITGSNVLIIGPSGEEHSFAFDNVFDVRSTQPEVWESVGLPILDKAFSGYNGTIFAYGQTGSGKTWSMQGADGDLEGVIPRMNNSVFDRITKQKAENPHLQFLVTASYFELYNEIIFDLLDPTDRKKRSKSGLEIKEHQVLGVYVKGLQEIVVDNPIKMQAILDQGMKSRTVASTQMNADSSRSHSVFTIKIHQKDSEDESKNLFAKVNLVDLAGSERVKSTGATGATLKEGANINKSLSALGNVINALVECAKGKKGVFVPYRNSKLTRVLQESLGGNSITVMVAAISPAMCNFEETLSTLKYANRAKAIKVKAIKNDESSQISRLNEEIRMLREKLVTQNPTVDTSLLEAKHQQQLRDLEEAMKSTWEEKARISSDHERERTRLEREQQEAQKLISQQREDSWRLLETKGDVELSISHVKDLLRIAQPDGGIERISSWNIELKEIIKLEAELSEQYTVIDVYQSSLFRDSEMILKDKKNSSNIMADKMIVGQWKQLRDKYETISTECSKWIQIRSNLINSIENFLTTISLTESIWLENHAENSGLFEISQASRGLQLVQKQVQDKHQKYILSSSKMINIITAFTGIATRMEAVLASNIQKLTPMEFPTLNNSEELADLSQEKQKILNDALGNIKELKNYFASSGLLGKIQTNGLGGGGVRGSSTSGTQTSNPANATEESIISLYENVKCSNRASIKKASVGSSESWTISSLASVKEDADMPYIEITLPQPVHLTSVTIQGGLIPEQLLPSPDLKRSDKFTLPCGLGFDDCNGSIENTIKLIGDVISWETLVKKNPPEKFLVRPPVRFLFDLINLIVRTTNLSVYETIEETNWDVVSANKDTKMNFIDKILSYVSHSLQIPSPTNSAAIVSGTDAQQTNIFLQHLSLVGYCSKSQIPLRSVLSLPPPQYSPRASERATKDRERAQERWIDNVIIEISTDGKNFIRTRNIETNLMSGTDTKRIQLNSLYSNPSILQSVRSVRIFAVSWHGSLTSLRFNLSGYLKSTDPTSSSSSPSMATTAGPSASSSSGSGDNFNNLLQGLVILKNTSDLLARALNFLIVLQELETTRKQDEVRKRMENLADEKLLLEQKLASEKLALNNEKQGLEDQLRVALSKLHEAEQLLEQEKLLSIQYETLHKQVLNENQSLQLSLHEQMENNNELQSQLLKLQASSEKDAILMDNYRKKIDEDEEKLSAMAEEVENYKSLQLEWESEKDDLTNQITILTDERDSARQQEEELYGILKEKINDLERLQESYVDMTDRCNDYQDTMTDMREEMENLKEVLLVESRQFITASQSSTLLRGKSESDHGHTSAANDQQTLFSSNSFTSDGHKGNPIPTSNTSVPARVISPNTPPTIAVEPFISPVLNTNNITTANTNLTTKQDFHSSNSHNEKKEEEEEYYDPPEEADNYEEEFEDDFEF